MFTAFRSRAFDGASKIALRGMCLRSLCTPSLWGLITMVEGREGEETKGEEFCGGCVMLVCGVEC
jgi:hypothetical protein